ncbi:helix-turn-helix domain-containing protein [Nitrobacter sp. TKz-YC01]|uniref:helix-turn-helix domain-containing protein n=1 Tax=Nitrobacter sp. TKz-YC01 TaxID=3398703 RepID=UPI003A0FFAC8
MSEDVRRIVGSNVRRLRKAASISQAELANRMGVDRAYVSGLELGQRNPTIVTLWHVAKALDVDFNEIFGSSRGKPRGQKPIKQRAESKRLLSASPRKR